MYHEFSNTRRSEWKYLYFGKDLLPAAEKLLAEFSVKEKEARNLAASYLQDMQVGAGSQKMEEIRREIDRVSKIHEELKVYVHEFSRKPNEQYSLNLGDVVFFNFPDACT